MTTGAGTARGLKRDQVVNIATLSDSKNFVCKRKKFIINAFVDLKPVERFENGSDMSGLRSLDNSTSTSFGSVAAGEVDSLEGCDKENYSSQV